LLPTHVALDVFTINVFMKKTMTSPSHTNSEMNSNSFVTKTSCRFTVAVNSHNQLFYKIYKTRHNSFMMLLRLLLGKQKAGAGGLRSD
jgi:hypothetical protein